jgi:hypothetical protein
VHLQLLAIDPAGSVGCAAELSVTAGLLRAAGATEVEQCTAVTAADIDAALAKLGSQRLVIDADLAGLNLVVSRLLRARLLATADTAVLPRSDCGYLHRIGLPRDREAQLLTAVSGSARLVGVIKDDSGGVCVDHAQLGPWLDSDAGWWLRAVVDDQRLADGTARSVRVRRLGPAQLEASVRIGRMRNRTLQGRSLQLACDDALVMQDGLARERPRRKRTLWSEPALWNVAL